MTKTKSNEYGHSVRIRTETKVSVDKFCKRRRIIVTHFISDAVEKEIKRINNEDGC